MRHISCFRFAFAAFLVVLAGNGWAVTSAPVSGLKSRDAVVTVTTPAANRAESDIQIRRIKSLLAEAEISSDAFFTQVENMRKKLGQ